MENRLNELASLLQVNRRKANRLTMEFVLESARILQEARHLAGRTFVKWVQEKGHMDYDTALRHLRVAEFVKANTH